MRVNDIVVINVVSIIKIADRKFMAVWHHTQHFAYGNSVMNAFERIDYIYANNR